VSKIKGLSSQAYTLPDEENLDAAKLLSLAESVFMEKRHLNFRCQREALLMRGLERGIDQLRGRRFQFWTADESLGSLKEIHEYQQAQDIQGGPAAILIWFMKEWNGVLMSSTSFSQLVDGRGEYAFCEYLHEANTMWFHAYMLPGTFRPSPKPTEKIVGCKLVD